MSAGAGAATTLPATGRAQQLSSGTRAAYVILGVLALAFAAALLVSPFINGYLAAVTLYVFVVIALFLMGIFDIVASQSPGEAPSGVQTFRLIMGILIVLFAFVALIDVRFSFVVLWIFVGFALLFQGFYLLGGVGMSGRLEPWQKGLGGTLGVVDIVLAFLVFLVPILAFAFVLALIAIAVIAAALMFLTMGATGVKRDLRSGLDVPGFMPPSGLFPPPPAK